MNELITQVLHLMQKQNEINHFKNNPSNYAWLSYKINPKKLNAKDEIAIRLIAQKLTTEQCYKVIKQLNIWHKQNKNIEINDIPLICIGLLNEEYNLNIIEVATNRRQGNFRMVLRILGDFTPKIIREMFGNGEKVRKLEEKSKVQQG